MKVIFFIALILSSALAKLVEDSHSIQALRAVYHPKLPMSISGNTKLVEGKPTHSVEDQEEIKKLVPLTYDMPILTFKPSNLAELGEAINVGVI